MCKCEYKYCPEVSAARTQSWSCPTAIEEGFIQKKRKRSSLFLGGQNGFNFLLPSLCSTRTSWRIGWFAPYSSTRPGANQLILQIVLLLNSSRIKELNQFSPPRSCDNLFLLFCINPSSMPYSHDCLQIMLALVQYWMGQQQLLPRQKQACMYTCMQCMDIRACILSAVRQHRVSVGFIQCGPCVHVCTLSTGPLFVYFIPVICT